MPPRKFKAWTLRWLICKSKWQNRNKSLALRLQLVNVRCKSRSRSLPTRSSNKLLSTKLCRVSSWSKRRLSSMRSGLDWIWIRDLVQHSPADLLLDPSLILKLIQLTVSHRCSIIWQELTSKCNTHFNRDEAQSLFLYQSFHINRALSQINIPYSLFQSSHKYI